MLNYEFVLWIEGYIDLCPNSDLSSKKLRVIRNHLNLVKAVEGQLGDFNNTIFQNISYHIANQSNQQTLNNFRDHLSRELKNFLQEAFPT
jgi:hypothetical protein